MRAIIATIGSFSVLAALAVLLPGRNFLSSEALLVETLTSFAPQYALLALCLGAWQLWCRRWLRGSAFLLLLLPDLANVWVARDHGTPNVSPDGAPVSAGPRLTVFSANLFESARAVRSAVAQVEALDADIVWWSEFPRELDPETRARVGALDAHYPFGFELPAADGRDLRFLSRYPLRARQKFQPSRTRGRPALRLTVEVEGHLLTVFALHTHPPTSVWSLQARNETLTWVETQLAAHEGNALVMGDLNTSAFSPRFREFVQRSGLHCESPWRCAIASWPTFVPLLLTPIDHILSGGGAKVIELRRGRFTGSDHFPVIAEVVLGQDGPDAIVLEPIAAARVAFDRVAADRVAADRVAAD